MKTKLIKWGILGCIICFVCACENLNSNSKAATKANQKNHAASLLTPSSPCVTRCENDYSFCESNQRDYSNCLSRQDLETSQCESSASLDYSSCESSADLEYSSCTSRQELGCNRKTCFRKTCMPLNSCGASPQSCNLNQMTCLSACKKNDKK